MLKLSFLWDWIKGSALHQIIAAVLALLLFIGLLSQYPVTLEFSSIDIQDHIEVTKDTQYILRSVIDKCGAKVSVKTNTYYTKISNGD